MKVMRKAVDGSFSCIKFKSPQTVQKPHKEV